MASSNGEPIYFTHEKDRLRTLNDERNLHMDQICSIDDEIATITQTAIHRTIERAVCPQCGRSTDVRKMDDGSIYCPMNHTD